MIDYFSHSLAYIGNGDTPPVMPTQKTLIGEEAPESKELPNFFTFTGTEPAKAVTKPIEVQKVPEALKPKTDVLEKLPAPKCSYISLEVSEDGAFIMLNKVLYTVPDFYNKKMIQQRDKKTIDMVLIGHGIDVNSLPLE